MIGMRFITEFHLSGIEEHWQGFLKGNPMFLLIGNGFSLIPFEASVIADYCPFYAASRVKVYTSW